ncbi:LamG domain-containing protein [Planctomycetota bacterium]
MLKRRLCLMVAAALALACSQVMGDVVTGLEGYWPLDNDAQDFSGNDRHGTLIGDAHFINNGVFGEAMELDGDGDFVSIDGYKGILQPPWTLACWIQTSTAGDLDIVSWGSEGGGLKVEFRLHDGRLRIEHGNGNNRGDAQIHDGQWHHGVAVLPEGGVMEDVIFYLDGEPLDTFQVGNGNNPFITTEGIDFNIGRSGPRGDRHFTGLIDEMRIYSRELSQDDIREMMKTSAAEMNPLASGPIPADGSRYEDTWVTMSWKPGAFAVSHDVYMDDNFANVNNGTGDTFQLNQESPFFMAGFPGFPYPDGLVPGTTYYWRIDEVNDADPNSPWKGDVWSFTVPPLKAFESDPANGSSYIDPAVTLSWKAGMNVKLHHVYFGDNIDEVSNATDALPQAETTYSPGSLTSGKTYYWRIDEFDGTTMHKGDVWSFTTLPEIMITDPNLLVWYKLDESPGVTAVDWSGHSNNGTLMGTAGWTVPGVADQAALKFGQSGYVAIRNMQYNGEDYSELTVSVWMRTTNPGEQIIAGFGRADYWRVGIDSYSAGQGLIDWDVMTSAGQVEHGSVTRVDNGAWHHVCCVFDNGRMTIYIDGLDDSTVTEGTTFGSGQARYGFLGADSLAATYDGNRDFINALLGDIDDFRIYDRALTQEEITIVMRGDPFLAWNPSPADGSVPDIHAATSLMWSAGEKAVQHDVYFGTDQDAVQSADDSDTTNIYRDRQDTTSYVPPEGVEWGGGPYYWRIDEYNADSTISKGRTWSFTVADFILVDDFESYNGGDNQIWFSWHDGLGYGTPGTAEYYAGNGTGAAVGDETAASYTEETIVHAGGQSMPLSYDNNKQGFAKYSETELTLSYPRDWTEYGLGELSLWFRGNPASVGSFVEGPTGTYTMTASGADIWNDADEFHFSYKMLTGVGSIQAQVLSVDNTDNWAKVGVMIRETLEQDSKFAAVYITPGNGCRFQARADTDINATSDTSVVTTEQTAITAPYWVKIERDITGNFRGYYSINGSNWTSMSWNPQNISMSSNVYIGLALTSHNNNATCEAKFSDVTISGTVSTQWTNQDIGIASNDAEPLYVAVSNATGTPAVVVNDDPNAATIDTWTEWIIPLQAFAVQGIVLTDVDKIAIGLGTQGNMTVPGGKGKIYIDDIRLYQPREVTE